MPPARGFLADWQSIEWNLARWAVKLDDTTILDEAISLSKPQNLPSFHAFTVHTAIKDSANKLLLHLIHHGIPVTTLKNLTLSWQTFTPRQQHTLEILLAHGWDINARDSSRHGDSNSEPFLWRVLGNHALVLWCLDHGASLAPRDQTLLLPGMQGYPQGFCHEILEVAASRAGIETFELLRSRGAPMGWKTLHAVVESVLDQCPNEVLDVGSIRVEEHRRLGYLNCLARLRYFLDVVGLDVDAVDAPEGTRLVGRWGTPLCYVAGYAEDTAETCEVTWMLLDRGADPTRALELAESFKNPRFVEDVEAWRRLKGGGGEERKCCVQQ